MVDPLPRSRPVEVLRWGLAVAGAVTGTLALIVVLQTRAERRTSEAVTAKDALRDPGPLPAPKESVPSSARRPSEPDAAEPPAPARPGRLVGRVAFPHSDRGRRAYTYQIVIFGADGTMVGPHVVSNSDRFEIAHVAPGRKAVVFFSTSESLTCPYQVATVPEGGEVEVILRPAVPTFLQGKVVDTSGAPVGGVYVTAAEVASLPQELYLDTRPSAIEALTTPIRLPTTPTGGAVNPEDPPAGYLRIDPREGRFARSAMTDSHGRFAMPLSSDVAPVPLSVTRNLTEVLKEETVLPSAGFARIVVPFQ